MSVFTILSFSLAGCASKLTPYEPREEILEKKNKTVIVQPICCSESYIDDREAAKSKLCIKILDTEGFHEWVNDALTMELINTGYSVVNSNGCVEPDIESSVYTITHGPFKCEKGLITLDINVSQGGARIFGRQYRAHEVMTCRLWELFVPGHPVVKKLFNRSLQGICSEFIADLDLEISRNDGHSPKTICD